MQICSTFLQVCRNNNLILNAEKMQFTLPKVSFFGHTWSDRGLSPDPKKIEAVKKMEIPQDVETMRSFLGLVNYLNAFSPHLAELSDLLREICRQVVEFKLTTACKVAFQCTRVEISKNVTLGAVLLQNSKLVMFASRALTGSERNYQNLEQEYLAMIWGTEKFHYFLYEKEFTLEMDQSHKCPSTKNT